MVVPSNFGSSINKRASIILCPLSPNRWAYLLHCSNISVSVKASVGRWITSFTIPLLFSNNSLLARMLEIENAETFGSSARFVVGLASSDSPGCGLGIIVSVGTNELGLSISAFGSATFSMLLFSLPLPLPLELLLTFSTIE
jgi:hypothetical protein